MKTLEECKNEATAKVTNGAYTVFEVIESFAGILVGFQVISAIYDEAAELYALQYKGEQWISVEDRLPDRNILVMVSNYQDEWVCCGDYQDDDCWYNQFSDDTIEVTHWMKLPSAPIKKETKP